METNEQQSDDSSLSDNAEKLERDESAYVMYHKAEMESSCLSFDFIFDKLGENRTIFPHTCYVVAGTQTPSASANRILVMKMSNLLKTQVDKNEEIDNSDDDDEDEEEKTPDLDTVTVRHNDCVNRIRVTQINDTAIAASWSANGTVYIWDLTRPTNAVDDSTIMSMYTKNNESPRPIFSFNGHQAEGYGLDWSPLKAGQLLTGDCKKNIHVWTPQEGGKWVIDQRPFTGHLESVEDIQWSPNESNVFASCSVDKSIRIWDTRATPNKACMLTLEDAHTVDVNVLNWNTNEPFLVSGGDDGIIKIWDLRQFKNSVALFKQHTAPITSVEWHPTDSSVFAACAADDRLTLWDLAVEREMIEESHDEPDVPPQLLFVHQGQKDMKELHWHTQIPGVIVSTALNGFNVFKTISV